MAYRYFLFEIFEKKTLICITRKLPQSYISMSSKHLIQTGQYSDAMK
jgi:hypothetical protein